MKIKMLKTVRDVAIIVGCYAGIAISGWLLGTKVAAPATARLILGEDAEN